MDGGVVSLLITIAIIGLIAWAIVYFIPMPPKFGTAIYVIAGIACLLMLLEFIGASPRLGFG